MKLNNYSLIYQVAPAKTQTKTPHRKRLHQILNEHQNNKKILLQLPINFFTHGALKTASPVEFLLSLKTKSGKSSKS